MIRPDRIAFLSTLPNYINESEQTSNMAVSGTVAAAGTSSFQVVFTITANDTRNDVYAKNQNTGRKQLISNSAVFDIFQFTGLESVQIVTAITSTTLAVTLTVTNNTGAPIVLTNQTFTISVLSYKIPF